MASKTGIPSIDADVKKLEKLQARSDKAKGLVGKFFQIQKADGYAYYTVVAEKGSRVKVKHHALMDGYQSEILCAGGWFHRTQIEPIIRQQEAFSKAMEEVGRRNMSEVVEDISLGPWVYCGQHLAPHRSGWCTVGLKDKVGLGEFKGAEHEQATEAADKCRRLGLKLFQDRKDSCK